MARPLHSGAMRSSGYVVEPARAEDDGAIRELLRSLPMDGPISLTFEREPAFELAAALEGERRVTVLARDRGSNRLVGMGSRAVRWAWINGEPERIGYLAQLRRRPELIGGYSVLAAGYDICEASRRSDELPYDITCILEGNRVARRLLERGLPGLPTYRRFAELHTLVLPVRWRRGPATVRRGCCELLPEIARCLDRNLRRYQFAPLWTDEDLKSSDRARGLEAEDFLVHVSEARVGGAIALWDQRRFKQVVVRGYSRTIAEWRWLLNLALTVGRRPRLPAVGADLKLAYLSHLAVDGDSPEVAVSLVRGASREAARRGMSFLVVCFAAGNPMLPAVRAAFPCRELRSWLYLTHHGDAPPEIEELDGRCPYVEAATL